MANKSRHNEPTIESLGEKKLQNKILLQTSINYVSSAANTEKFCQFTYWLSKPVANFVLVL